MPLRGCFHTCFWHLHYCIPTFFASQPSFAAYGVCSCFYLPRILCSRLAQKYDCAHHAWVTGQDRENGKASTDWRVSLFFTCLSLWCKQFIVAPCTLWDPSPFCRVYNCSGCTTRRRLAIGAPPSKTSPSRTSQALGRSRRLGLLRSIRS